MNEFKYNLKDNTKSNKDEVFSEAIYKCYKEMYANAQPPVDYDELIKLAKEGKEDKNTPFYMQHYISEEEYKYIIEKYIHSYGLKDEFPDHCDVILRYFDDGTIDKYIERNGDEPGYRGYEKLKPLKELIGEEHYNIVIERVKQAQGFYKFNRDESSFHWNMMYSSPCTNKQTVIDYWKSQGVDLVIEDRDDEMIFDRYYYGEVYTDDEYSDNIKEVKTMQL